ncbi:MAG: glycosyltransferase [Verrucomicrobia bacterium]|nr:MAG: glycosyltransferase [Verrucomicrobiota bacterium]
MNESSWICCQIGAREHYAVPRALFRREALRLLITDAWVQPRSVIRALGSGLRERFHPELASASTKAWNIGLIAFEAAARIRKLSEWQRVISRNRWFQRRACAYLGRKAETPKTELIIFAYSYAARDIFRFAKQRGWKTALGQIDPGPVEEKIVADEAARVPELAGDWRPAPPEYWDNWQEECSLADHIIVNSKWSRSCLLKAGVNGEKVSVIPLAYEPITNTQITRAYPARFTRDRPLRVLFLGQVNLRKGVAHLFNAIRSFKDEPIEFWFVGPMQVFIPSELQNNPRVRWFDVVSRGEVDSFYRKADLLILPTLSDGFGLTQLEAQAWSLPIVASRFCGEVVRDGQNGLLLENLTGETIREVLRQCVANPELLAQLAAGSGNFEVHSLDEVSERLFELLADGRQEAIPRRCA